MTSKLNSKKAEECIDARGGVDRCSSARIRLFSVDMDIIVDETAGGNAIQI